MFVSLFLDSHCHIDFIFSRLAGLSSESEDVEKIEIEVLEEIEEGEIDEDIAIIREELVEVMEVKNEVNEEIEVYKNFKEFQEKYKDEFPQNFQGDQILVTYTYLSTMKSEINCTGYPDADCKK